jgi:hypothetical protein
MRNSMCEHKALPLRILVTNDPHNILLHVPTFTVSDAIQLCVISQTRDALEQAFK